MRRYNVEQRAEKRFVYEFVDKNRKGEKISVEIIGMTYEKGGLPELWLKYGYIRKLLDSYMWVDVYVTDKEGNCYNRYNPTIKRAKEGNRNVINFDWLMEFNDNNIKKVLREIERLAFE